MLSGIVSSSTLQPPSLMGGGRVMSCVGDHNLQDFLHSVYMWPDSETIKLLDHPSTKTDEGRGHRIDRALSFLSSRPNWDPPPLPSPASQCVPYPPSPPLWFCGGGRGHTRLWERVGGEPIWTKEQIHGTLGIYVCTLWEGPQICR
jgi:hypothetical protein